jgi:hypothetical protein
VTEPVNPPNGAQEPTCEAAEGTSLVSASIATHVHTSPALAGANLAIGTFFSSVAVASRGAPTP